MINKKNKFCSRKCNNYKGIESITNNIYDIFSSTTDFMVKHICIFVLNKMIKKFANNCKLKTENFKHIFIVSRLVYGFCIKTKSTT